VIYADRVSPEGATRLVDFVLVHEIGHALVDVYRIPVRGKEEAAVDAIATVLLRRFVHGGTGIAVAGADFLGAPASKRGTSSAESDFWREHSLGRRRADTLVCLVRRRCGDEVGGWYRLLKPHLKV
jgi:Putative metallopeptidase